MCGVAVTDRPAMCGVAVTKEAAAMCGVAVTDTPAMCGVAGTKDTVATRADATDADSVIPLFGARKAAYRNILNTSVRPKLALAA